VIFDIVVFDGLDELDAIGPLEVLRRAHRPERPVTTRLVHHGDQTRVTGAFGLRIDIDKQWVLGEADVVIVVGGGWAKRAPVGAWAEHERGVIEPMIAASRDVTRVVAGVCTGTMLIAHAGLARGRRASTHHSSLAELAALGVDVVGDRVVDDGDLVTCGGVTSGIDLALWLVEREIDATLADSIASNLEYSRQRPFGALR